MRLAFLCTSLWAARRKEGSVVSAYHITACLNAQEKEADKKEEGVLLPFVDVTYLPSQTPEFDRTVL